VAGPGRIFIWENFFRRGFARINQNNFGLQNLEVARRLSVWDGFSRGFHRISSGFTASAQIILRFALYSLMLKWANGSQW
jgi:hypothetical protein